MDCVTNISNIGYSHIVGSRTTPKIYFLVRFVFKTYCLKKLNGTFKFVWFLVSVYLYGFYTYTCNYSSSGIVQTETLIYIYI